jgi:hypothetical protein
MNIVKEIDQYDERCIYFCDPIKNNIMCDSNFIRILYSTRFIVLNGIYLLVKLNDFTTEKYYNKYKCNFNIHSHSDLINSLKNIEENILKKMGIEDKTPQFKVYEQLKTGSIKIFGEAITKQNNLFILKISGVWETPQNYGLTYKFIKINS